MLAIIMIFFLFYLLFSFFFLHLPVLPAETLGPHRLVHYSFYPPLWFPTARPRAPSCFSLSSRRHALRTGATPQVAWPPLAPQSPPYTRTGELATHSSLRHAVLAPTTPVTLVRRRSHSVANSRRFRPLFPRRRDTEPFSGPNRPPVTSILLGL